MTGTGTGLDAQLGFVAEGSYGGGGTVTRFFEFDSESLKHQKVTVQGTGQRAGGRFARRQRRVITTRAAGGSFSGDLVTSGMGLLFKAATGTSTSVQRGSTAVYDQTHTPSGLLGLSLCIQKGMPRTSDGGVEPFTLVGGKVTSLDVSIAKGGLAKVAVDIDGQDMRTTASSPAGPALATASYSTGAVPYSFLSAALTLGGSPIAAVTKANVKLSRAMKTDRYYLGAGGLKAEPLENAMQKVDGTLEADFTTRAALYDAYEADTALAMVLTFTGPVIGGTSTPNSLTITVPSISLNGDTPTANGPDVLSLSVPYEGLDDGTNPVVSYAFVTADTTY
jgi:hypothetical protein